MNKVEILVLNGSPGSGKSALTYAISEQLRMAKVTNAVIDVDWIALIYPKDEKPLEWKKNFMWKNLTAIWPNYVAVGEIKIIIPVVIDNDKDLESLKIAT